MPQIFSAVKAIIRNDKNEFIILKQKIGNTHVWDLPGGRIEYGESPLETLTREIKEEVCLDVTINTIAGIWWFFRFDQAQVICTTWLCSPITQEINICANPAQEDIIEYMWISAPDFLQESYVVSHASLKELVSQLAHKKLL